MQFQIYLIRPFNRDTDTEVLVIFRNVMKNESIQIKYYQAKVTAGLLNVYL